MISQRICENIKNLITNRINRGCSGAKEIKIDYSIQSYDSQYTLVGNDPTLTNFNYTDSFSIGCKLLWDSATETIGADAIVLLENRNASGLGWQLAFRKQSNDIRLLLSDGTNFNVITWNDGFTPVVGEVYAVWVTQDGTGNYKCFLNAENQTEKSKSTPIASSTVSDEPFRIGTNRSETSNVRFRGLMNDIIFTNHYATLSDYSEWNNSASILDDISGISYSVLGYFNANNYESTSGFVSLVDSSDKILTPNERSYFQLPYNIYNYNPTPTINASNYGSNPIVDGTSLYGVESYAGDVCTAPDGDIVAVVKCPDNPFTRTYFFIFKGVDFDNLIEINKNSFPFPNFPISEVGTIRIRREGNTYYLIARRQLNGSVGGAGERDICILETTDLTTDPSTWTQHLNVIDKDLIPYEGTGTGDWDLLSPSDLFKYNGKYYMTAVCGNTLDYIHLFESDNIASGYSWKKSIFSTNEQDWLNTLSPSISSANIVQGGSIIKDGNYYYCCVTLGMENSDNKNERYLAIGRGKTPFDFEFYKTVLHQSGADGTYSERRAYDGQFIKKSDGSWLKPELIDSKYWLSYAGHSYMSNRPQAWDSNGKLSLMSWTPGNLIS